jgi:ankyrin repeat protein
MTWSRAILVAIAVGACALAMPACVKAPFGGEPESALIRATAARDVAEVERLLASGANPNKMVPYEGLNHSSWERVLNQLRPKHPEDVEIIKAMLRHGANPMAAWGEGQAMGITRQHDTEPLMIVMLHPNADAVRALLQAGMKSRWGEAALVMAIEQGESEIAHLLVDSGVDVNGRHGAALTPLVAAIEARDFKMMVFLEEHGAREKP